MKQKPFFALKKPHELVALDFFLGDLSSLELTPKVMGDTEVVFFNDSYMFSAQNDGLGYPSVSFSDKNGSVKISYGSDKSDQPDLHSAILAIVKQKPYLRDDLTLTVNLNAERFNSIGSNEKNPSFGGFAQALITFPRNNAVVITFLPLGEQIDEKSLCGFAYTIHGGDDNESAMDLAVYDLKSNPLEDGELLNLYNHVFS